MTTEELIAALRNQFWPPAMEASERLEWLQAELLELEHVRKIVVDTCNKETARADAMEKALRHIYAICVDDHLECFSTRKTVAGIARQALAAKETAE